MSSSIPPRDVYDLVDQLAAMKEGFLKVDNAGKLGKRVVIVPNKDDQFKSRSIMKVLTMASAFQTLAKELNKQDDTIALCEKRLEAYRQIKIKYQRMQKKINQRNPVIRIFLKFLQTITGSRLDKAFWDIEKHFIKDKINRNSLLFPPRVGDYVIQPDDATIADRVNQVNKKLKKLEQIINQYNKPTGANKAISNPWADEKFIRDFDILMKEAEVLGERLLSDEFELIYWSWLNLQQEKNDDSGKSHANLFLMLDSKKTYLSEAILLIPKLYRLARFSAERMDEKAGWAFKYRTDSAQDDYTKQFYDINTKFGRWNKIHNDYCARLAKKNPQDAYWRGRIAVQDKDKSKAPEPASPPPAQPKGKAAAALPIIASAQLEARNVVSNDKFLDWDDTFKIALPDPVPVPRT